MTAPIFNGRTPSGRIVANTGTLDLTTLGKWRAVIYDKQEGIVVIDVDASNEAEAKMAAFRAATEHLKLTQIAANIMVRSHIDMPKEWLRYKTRTLNHVKLPKNKR